jgi:pimeloyl-ACP methyl ester carboxylesterase
MNLITKIPFLLFLLMNLTSYGSYASSSLERSDGTKIEYYLEMASHSGASDTLFVFFQGSDCNSVKHNDLIKQLSQATLQSADLLLIEKAGINSSLPYVVNAERADCPRFYIQNDSIQQRAKDANVVVSKVLEDNAYKNVIALGGSEGAVVAALFAADYRMVNGVVMLNGGGQWFLDDVIHNIKSTTPESELNSVLEGFKGFASHILKSEPFDIEVSHHGYIWWESALTIDQKEILSRVNVPVLVIQGGRDTSVSVDAVGTLIEDLHNLDKGNIELITIPEMDHGLSDPAGLKMVEDIAKYISEWLKAV